MNYKNKKRIEQEKKVSVFLFTFIPVVFKTCHTNCAHMIFAYNILAIFSIKKSHRPNSSSSCHIIHDFYRKYTWLNYYGNSHVSVWHQFKFRYLDDVFHRDMVKFGGKDWKIE